MSHRRSFAETPRLLGTVFELLEVVFPGIGRAVGEAERLGLDWGAVSTPFVRLEGDAVVSHVGVMEVPVVVDGHEQLFAAVHAVATHPDHRRRGHYRACIEEALAWIDGRLETTMLTTDQPALYEPFGFRAIQEWLARGPLPEVARGRTDDRRRLDLDEPDDVRLLRRLLRERAPVSPRLGVVRELDGFAFYAAREPLWYLPGVDAVVWYVADEERLVIRDLVATEIPDLTEVLACLPERPPTVEIEFTPDVVAPGLPTTPHALDGNDRLMVRGPLPVEGTPIMLPRTARF